MFKTVIYRNFKNTYFHNNLEKTTLHAVTVSSEIILLFSNGNDLVMRLFSNYHLSYVIIGLALKCSLLTQYVEPISLLMTYLHTVI
jgi:hypothetical protein